MGTEKAGAAAPAIEVDAKAATSWAAFKLMRVLGDDDASSIRKMDAAMEYAGLVAHMDEDAIVAMAGEDPQIDDVMAVVSHIISMAAPKN